MAGSDEQRLLRELRAGSREACAALISAHYQRIYRFLVHLAGDVHEAEDLTQETFTAAWRNLAGFDGRASFATWLCKIAHGKFVDGKRAARRRLAALERRDVPLASDGDPTSPAQADDETQRLHRALRDLDDAERTLLVLHYLQGLSYREMATVLDEPSGTVKWRVAQALNQLRLVLNDEVREHALD